MGQIPAQSVEFDCQIQYMSIDFSERTVSIGSDLVRLPILSTPTSFQNFALLFWVNLANWVWSSLAKTNSLRRIRSFCHYFQPPPLLFKITSLGTNSTRAVLLGILGWGVPPGSPNPDPFFYFRPKNVIFHTRFQTRPLKSIPVFRLGLLAEIISSLLKLERKQNNSSYAFRIRIYGSYSYAVHMLT